MVILSMALFFWTIALMPVGIAGAVRGIGPLFIPIGAIFFLREKATFNLFFTFCIAMAGAMIATETAIPNKATFALTIGIISAALSGLAAPLGKHLQKHDDLLVLVTWPAFGGIILTTGWVAIAGFTMPDIWVALSLSIAGVFGYLGWFLLQWAYQTEVVLFVWTEKRQS